MVKSRYPCCSEHTWVHYRKEILKQGNKWIAWRRTCSEVPCSGSLLKRFSDLPLIKLIIQQWSIKDKEGKSKTEVPPAHWQENAQGCQCFQNHSSQIQLLPVKWTKISTMRSWQECYCSSIAQRKVDSSKWHCSTVKVTDHALILQQMDCHTWCKWSTVP